MHQLRERIQSYQAAVHEQLAGTVPLQQIIALLGQWYDLQTELAGENSALQAEQREELGAVMRELQQQIEFYMATKAQYNLGDVQKLLARDLKGGAQGQTGSHKQ